MKNSSWARLMIAFALTLFLGACGGGVPSPTVPRATTTARATPSWVIDIGAASRVLRGKSAREIDDQVRDWAVYGSLVQHGYSSDAIAKAMHRTIPVRLAYLEDAYPFDYGRGRRAIVGSDTLLFVDADDPDSALTIGRLADRVRMETGEKPDRVEVYSVEPDVSRGTIRVWRKPDILAKDLFGAAYGYVEARVASRADFEAWLRQVDDLSIVQSENGALSFGGRRGHGRTVGVEDVSALYQAQTAAHGSRVKFKDDLDRLDKQLDREVDELNTSYKDARDKLIASYTKRLEGVRSAKEESRLLETAKADIAALDDDFSARKEAFKSSIEDRQSAIGDGVIPYPGFSLDPEWRGDGLAEALTALANDPCSAARSAVQRNRAASDADPATRSVRAYHDAQVTQVVQSLPDLQAVCDDAVRHYRSSLLALAADVQNVMATTNGPKRQHALDQTMVKLFKLKKVLEDGDQPDAELVDALTDDLNATQHLQCARYDGPLAGTRVAMNLFYTDLLAKLWQSVDRGYSAPTEAVPGFLSKPRLFVEPKWRNEVLASPNTRIWFGPKKGTYARLAANTMAFDHVSTRVYSAGSDPTDPDKEGVASEPSRRTIGWWDRHFAAVADYENEYQLLNQIMKWSVATAWLADEGKGSFLGEAPVKHDLRFDRWLSSARSTLRYEDPVQLRPSAESPTGTECLDLLVSYPYRSLGSNGWIIEGGVSLAAESDIKEALTIDAKGDRALRVTASADPDVKAPTVTDDGVAKLDVKDARKRVGPVNVDDVLRIDAVDTRVAKSGDDVSLQMSGGPGKDIGTLTAQRSGDHVALAWTSGSVDTKVASELAKADPLAKSLFDSVATDDMNALTAKALQDLRGGAPQRGLDALQAPSALNAADRAKLGAIPGGADALVGVAHPPNVLVGDKPVGLQVIADGPVATMKAVVDGSVVPKAIPDDARRTFGDLVVGRQVDASVFVPEAPGANAIDVQSSGGGMVAAAARSKRGALALAVLENAGLSRDVKMLEIGGVRYRRLELEGLGEDAIVPKGDPIFIVEDCNDRRNRAHDACKDH